MLDKDILNKLFDNNFKDVNTLCYYGRKLISANDNELARKCFNKCLALEPNNLSACFQMFMLEIRQKNYDKAFLFFDKLLKSDNEFYHKDYNYYLYLLNIITDIPCNYRKNIERITYEDLMIPNNDKRYKDIYLQNKIRLAVFRKKFPYALKQLNDLVKKHKKMTVQDVISMNLLIQTINANKKIRSTVMVLIRKKQYNELLEFLLEREKRCGLSKNEVYIVKLVKTILTIKESLTVPEIKDVPCKNLFDAIDANNYHLALKLSNDYKKKYSNVNTLDAINFLLNDIISLIDTKL